MKPIYKKLSLGIVATLMLCCSGGDSSGGIPDPQPVPDPVAAILIFPANNTECNEGEILSAQQSRVTFQWNASQNTDSYEVRLTNLNTNSITSTISNTNEAAIVIQRATPYEWSVTSRARGSNQTASSPVWRFYNAGEGVSNYAPFPATAIFPERGSTLTNAGTITLQWETSDIDGDLASFEVYLEENNTGPQTLIGTTSENFLEVTVSPSSVYYWQVVSKDAAGNSSVSEVFQFAVE
ncbi:hypothetical protein ACT6NV_09190 [Robiginitalea sp. IMCC44478]|uniref:hypothetical protein n=1 Tax=Robiginitalea sp. IMCC44478 TaxID=3459122 RepID=UPI00404103CC